MSPYSKGGTYKFLGFIYLPLEFENEIKTELEEYTKGNYITLEEMNIRSGAGYKFLNPGIASHFPKNVNLIPLKKRLAAKANLYFFLQ